MSVEINRPTRPAEDGVGRDAILNELRGIPGVNDNVVRQQISNRYPHAPRLDPLRAALARFEAASKFQIGTSPPAAAPKPTPHPKAPPPAKADKRARR
jgi:hypothetical protein